MLYYIISAANKNNWHFHFLTTNKNLQTPTRSLKVNEIIKQQLTRNETNEIERCWPHSSTALIILHILLFLKEFKLAVEWSVSIIIKTLQTFECDCFTGVRNINIIMEVYWIIYTLSGRMGKVVASHAAVARSIPAEVSLIYTIHEALRGYCPWGWGVRLVNWIYRLWRHCP